MFPATSCISNFIVKYMEIVIPERFSPNPYAGFETVATKVISLSQHLFFSFLV